VPDRMLESRDASCYTKTKVKAAEGSGYKGKSQTQGGRWSFAERQGGSRKKGVESILSRSPKEGRAD